MQTEVLSSLSTERQLIGAMLLDAARVADQIDAARQDAGLFASTQTLVAYRAIMALLASGRPVDALSVAGRIKEQGDGQKCPYEALEGFLDDCPTAAHAEYYIQSLADKAARRRMLAMLDRAKVTVADPDQSAAMIHAGIEASLSAAMPAGQAAKSNAALLADYDAMYERALAGGCAGIRTGFPLWDEHFGGLQPKVYYAVSGPPGCFKTTLVRNIMENVAGQQGLRVDMASLEQSAGQILASMAARMAGVTISLLQSGREPEALERWRAACAQVQAWPVYICDEAMDDKSLWAWARRAKTAGSRLLVLDYLQFVKASDAKISEEQRVARASEAVRRIAFDLDIPFVCISSESNEGKLRHSGQVEYDAWCWLRMRKDEDSMGNVLGAAVAIKKNRFGPQMPEERLPHWKGVMGASRPERDDE
jgi:replicative DNA helicase